MTSEPEQRPSPNTSDDFFRKLASGVPGVLFAYWRNADGSDHFYPYVSERVQELFGIEPDALGTDAEVMFSIMHPDDRSRVAQSIIASSKLASPWQCQARLLLRSGRYHWFEGHAVPEPRADGSVIWYGQFNDVQGYKFLEEKLRAEQEESQFHARFQRLMAQLSSDFLGQAFDNGDAAINQILSAFGRFFSVDRAYLYRFSDDLSTMSNTHEWTDQGVASLLEDQQEVSIEDFIWWQGEIRQMVSGSHVVFVESVSNLAPEAVNEKALLTEQGVQSLICVPVRVHGRVSGFFGVDSLEPRSWRKDQVDLLLIVSGLISGVLERDLLEQELLERSVKDPLTGLYNRRYLIPRIDEMLGSFVREQQPFALAMFDLDHFKQINDRFGHLCGDQILRDFAGTLSNSIRAVDVVARFGGEEFVVALPATSAADAAPLVGRILDRVRKHRFSCNGQSVEVTASAGVVAAGEPGIAMGCEAMLAEADQRLYRAKSSGRDCLVSLSGLSRI